MPSSSSSSPNKVCSKTTKTVLNGLKNILKAYYIIIIEHRYAWVLKTVNSLTDKALLKNNEDNAY